MPVLHRQTALPTVPLGCRAVGLLLQDKSWIMQRQICLLVQLMNEFQTF